MAHFAKLDPNTNTVLDVVYVDNELLQDENGVEREHIGADKLEAANPGFTFKQTSYNTEANEHRAEGDTTPFRKNYASIGGKYDEGRDAFVAERWLDEQCILDPVTCQWYTAFEGRQDTDNAGNPMPFDDRSEYQQNAARQPQDWVWNNKTKTYQNTAPTKRIGVNYRFNSTTQRWEEV